MSLRISICIPTYNRKSNLSELLEALAKIFGADGTKSDWEGGERRDNCVG